MRTATGNKEMLKYLELLMDERNSMTYWYPRIAKHPNVPRTRLFPVEPEDVVSWIEEGLPKEICRNFRRTIEEFVPELPLRSGNFVFIRGSRASDKFHFESVCKLDLTKFERLSEREKDSEIARRIIDIAEFHVMNDLPLEALVVREFIRIPSWFFAFDGLPIGMEARVIVEDGKAVEWWPYWPWDAIKDSVKENREVAKRFLWEIYKWLIAVRHQFISVAEDVYRFGEFEGAWSVDVAMEAVTDKWYVIDMALAEVSWRPENDFFVFRLTERGKG